MDNFDEEIFKLNKKDFLLRVIPGSGILLDVILLLVNNIFVFAYPYPDAKEDIEDFSYEDFKNTINQPDFSNYIVTIIKNRKL